MSQEYDGFQDLVDDPGGIVSGQELLRVKYQVTKDGFAVESRCQYCGKTHVVTAAWPELVALSTGMSPDVAFSQSPQFQDSAYRWNLVQGYWVPDGMKCRCGYNVSVGLSPRDVASAIQRGAEAGHVNPQWVQQVQQLCAQARGGPR